jgi:hypothetical protein
MSGMDTLIAKSLCLIIEKNLGKNTLQKVEHRLFEKYGMSLTQSIEDFPKLDNVLRDFFGEGAEGVERQFLENIVKVENIQFNEPSWVEIKDSSLNKQIIDALGDDDKKNMLDTVLTEPRSISDIIEIAKVSESSGYSKVNSLIENGLLTVYDSIDEDGKNVNRYKSVFENVTINIEKNKVIVKVFAKESLEKSSVIQLVHCR